MSGVTVVNFSHPLTEEQRDDIERRVDDQIERVIDVATHFDHDLSFADEVQRLVEQVGLTPQEWQAPSVVINPPALAPGAVVLVAYLHGLMGHFPRMIRIRPAPGESYAVGEVVSLRDVREDGRRHRWD